MYFDLYTGLFLPCVIFTLLHLQIVSPSLEFDQTQLCFKRHWILVADNRGKRGENKSGANNSLYTIIS